MSPTAPGPMPGATPAPEAALRVAYYCSGWPVNAFTNGVVTYVSTMVEELRRLGHHTRVLAAKTVGPVADGGDEVVDLARDVDPGRRLPARLLDAASYRLAPATTRDARMARRLCRAADLLARRGGLDLVEIEESFGWGAGLARRVPVVVRLHGPWFINGEACGDRPGGPAYERRVRAEGLALRRAAAVSAPSRLVLERTREHYGLALEGAEVIPNPVRPCPTGRRWRAEGAEPGRILFVGRYDRIKGGDTMIDAFARLARDRPDARLDFIGPDGHAGDGGLDRPLAEHVESRLPGALAEGRVRLLGRRPHAELDDHRRRAAVVVMASRTENFPLALAEAMALGCPLVATRVGGVPELIEDQAHGLLCRPDDPEDMAAKLAGMLADPSGAAAMGRRAADRCACHFASDVVAALTVAFYRRALARAARGSRP